jgi:hypothetical protein
MTTKQTFINYHVVKVFSKDQISRIKAVYDLNFVTESTCLDFQISFHHLNKQKYKYNIIILINYIINMIKQDKAITSL